MSVLPKISILMPAYNTEKYVGEAIESILNQTFDDFELIIIDDCSTDRTFEILQIYSEKDCRISLYKNDLNLGISKTRNKLISLAKAKYIAWQDADDISLPNRLNLQYNFMEQNPQVGISGGTLEFFNSEKILSNRKYKCDDYSLRSLIFKQSPVAQPAAIIRRNILDKAGLFDESLLQAEDLDMSLRIGLYSKFGNLNETLIQYRFHENSITSQKLHENIRCTLKVRRRAMAKYGYTMNPSDVLYFIITFIFKFLPSKFTYNIFNFARNN